MDLMQKLEILADAAKYDVACTSSGVQRSAQRGQLGSARAAGCCHSFTPDGRCISLLKVLMTNVCIYDCAYCANRRSNERERCTFTPRELADLTMEFYRRNYIEGLFLSSGVLRTPDYTTELMIRTLEILRFEYRFNGYIHAKTVPGTAPELIDRLASLADRLSVNLELPSQESLALLAPQKSRQDILSPMKRIAECSQASKEERALARRRTTVYAGHTNTACLKRRGYAPAGQSTQLIVGATPESDLHILNLTAALYRNVSLKRVFFSAYLPVNRDKRLPDTDAVQLDREHRLYQADWLLRFYRFNVTELIDDAHPFLETDIDPKANWALNHLDLFPVEVNTAPYETLLRVPGIGVRGAKLIVGARRTAMLRADDLRKLGIAYKRARYFLTCNGVWGGAGCTFSRESLHAKLASPIDGGAHGRRADRPIPGQLSLFGNDDEASASQTVGYTTGRSPRLGDNGEAPASQAELRGKPAGQLRASPPLPSLPRSA
jgi:putative DNA modification/repair radical SAM protein